MDGDFVVQFPEFDPGIAEVVALDQGSRTLYVEPRRITDTLIQSWLRRCKTRGIEVKVEPTELDEIQAKRQSGFRARVAVAAAADPEIDTGMIDMAVDIIKQAVRYRATDGYIRRLGTYSLVELTIKRSVRVLHRLTQEEGEALDRAFFTGLATSKSDSHSFLHFQEAEISGPEMEDLGLSTIRVTRGYSAPYGRGGGFMHLRFQPNGNGAVRPDSGSLDESTERQKQSEEELEAAAKKRLRPLPYPRLPDRPVDLLARGYDQKQVEKLLYLTEGTKGLVLFTGPVGSGKTTTMGDLLRHTAIVSPDLRQIFLERPVELPYPWAIQIPVIGDFGGSREAEGAAFADMMKYILRVSPHIIGVNEIRVAEVALLILEMARSGHKTYSSLHTEDPFEFADRLEGLDRVRLPKESFCNHKLIQGIVNQRLVPLLCDNCALPLSEAPKHYYTERQQDVLSSFGDLSKVRIRRAGGCRHCDFDGVTETTAVAEVIITDAELMNDLIHQGSIVARHNYRRRRPDADPSILSRAMDLTLQGRCDLKDVNKYLDRIERIEKVNE
jgi:hypothetical protein